MRLVCSVLIRLLKNKKFTINSFSRVNYRNQVAFLYNKETLHDDKNTTTGLTLAGESEWVLSE